MADSQRLEPRSVAKAATGSLCPHNRNATVKPVFIRSTNSMSCHPSLELEVKYIKHPLHPFFFTGPFL